jgi:hypothetical protein
MTQGDSERSDHGRRGPWSGDLGALIEALRRLSLQLGDVLLNHRLRPVNHRRARDDGADIRSAIDRRLQRAGSQANRPGAGATDTDPGAPGVAPPDTDARDAPFPAVQSSDLSSHLRGPGGVHLQLGESLQATTSEHVNKPSLAARRGDAAGARLHADLAQSAMRSASEHMPAAEYAAFKHSVAQWLQGLDEAQ